MWGDSLEFSSACLREGAHFPYVVKKLNYFFGYPY